jgi:hypothetical protein
MAAIAALTLVPAPLVGADIFSEPFSNDPAANGWRSFGNTNLFLWDSTAGKLGVTWDSSTSNSFYFHPLGTVLARDDDFSLAFDIRLQDIATTTKPGPFEIAVGLINLQSATRSDYWRGSGVDSLHGPRNLLELDYFPAGYYPGFGDVAPSLSPTIVSSNNSFASGFDLIELTNGVTYHVEIVYSASDSTLRTSVTSGGVPISSFGDVVLGGGFDDFRLDTVAVSSYSDTGDDYDSVLAHGTVDNLVVTMPAPPVQRVSGVITGGHYAVQFATQTNWIYQVEKSSDLRSWSAVGGAFAGTGAPATISDSLVGPGSFYRVNASRP